MKSQWEKSSSYVSLTKYCWNICLMCKTKVPQFPPRVLFTTFCLPLTVIVIILRSQKIPLQQLTLPIPGSRSHYTVNKTLSKQLTYHYTTPIPGYKYGNTVNTTLPEEFTYNIPPYDDKFKNPCFYDKHGTLQCLPYAFLLGMPKCGTTDLFRVLKQHPQIENTKKEPHWWTRRRFPNRTQYPSDLTSYSEIYKKHHLQISRNPDHIIVDASASTLWDMDYWSRYADYTKTPGLEPDITTAHYIHQILPQSRFIIILRNPTDRLYSDYLYFTENNDSSRDFDVKVQQGIEIFTTCIAQFSVRACVYNATLKESIEVRLTVGLYHIYIEDWLKVFPRDRFLILNLEEYHKERSKFLQYICKFLNIDSYPENLLQDIDDFPQQNSRKTKDRLKGNMLPQTRTRLTKFYQAYNDKLADLLQDSKYRWT